MKAYYDNKPSRIEAIGNGSWFYRWDIKEESVEHEGETRTQYSCKEVVVWSPITSNRVLQAVLEDKYPNNREQKYINEYNAAILGVYKDNEAAHKIETYKVFLMERDTIKNQVDSDCMEFGIK